MLQRARIDNLLTNMSVQYRNGIYIAERIYPVLPVDARTDQYPVFGRQNFIPIEDQRSPGGVAQEATWSWSPDTYICNGHALKDYVPRETQNEQHPAFDLLQDTTTYLTERMLLNQEIALVAKLAADLTGASLADQVAIKWSADANDPVKAFRTQADVIGKRIGMPPNMAAISAPVWTAIRNNATVKALITGGADSQNPADITPEKFAALIDVQNVVIGRAVKNTANPGQAESMDWVWGANALLAYVPPAPGRRTVSVGYTFLWRNAFQTVNGTVQGGQFVKRYYWEPNTADVVEVHKYYDQKTVAAAAGVLFTNCI